MYGKKKGSSSMRGNPKRGKGSKRKVGVRHPKARMSSPMR